MNKEIKIIFLILALVFITVILLIVPKRESSLSSDQIEDNFISGLQAGIDLNSGLVVTSDIKAFDFSDSDWFVPSDWFVLEVENNTDELIRFDSILLGLRVFRLDPVTNSWYEAPLNVAACCGDVFLSPIPVESPNPHVGTIEIQSHYIDIREEDRFLRFYVWGKGSETEKVYGAYIDVEVIRQANE